MKTFDELTTKQQAIACEKALAQILSKICDGSARFPGHPDMQDKIDAAAQEAERQQTPCFLPAHVLDTCKDELKSYANTYARSAYYREPGDLVLSL